MKFKKLHLFFIFWLITQFIVLKSIQHKTAFIEHNYALGIYPFISYSLRRIFGWIPFSIGDLGYLILLIALFYFCFESVKNKTLKTFFFNTIGVFTIMYFLFYCNWGMNYFRAPLVNQLQYTQKKYTTTTLNNYTLALISETNALHRSIYKNDSVQIIPPFSRKEIYNQVIIGYQNLAVKQPIFTYQIPSIKNAVISLPLTYMGFSGYLNPFTGEAQVNAKIPLYSVAFTASHEVAHQIGYAAENEANYIGYLACKHHDNPFFRLSGNITALKYLLSELSNRNRSLFEVAKSKINPGILKNFQESRVFWHRHANPFEPIFKIFYNNFLLANNQNSGIESYNLFVDLLLVNKQ